MCHAHLSYFQIIAILVDGFEEARENEINQARTGETKSMPHGVGIGTEIVGAVGAVLNRLLTRIRINAGTIADVEDDDEDKEADAEGGDEAKPLPSFADAPKAIADGDAARTADAGGDIPATPTRNPLARTFPSMSGMTGSAAAARIFLRTGGRERDLHGVHARIPDLDLAGASQPSISSARPDGGATARSGVLQSSRTGRATARVAPDGTSASAASAAPPDTTRALDISITRLGTVIVRRVDPSAAETAEAGGSSPRVAPPENEDAALVASLEARLREVNEEIAGPPPVEASKKAKADAVGDGSLGGSAAAASSSEDDEEAAAAAAIAAALAPKPRSRYVALAHGALVAARTYAAYLISHWVFDAVMMTVILYSCITLTLDSGDLTTCAKTVGAVGDRCRATKVFLSWSDFEVMIIFVGEAALNMFVRGLWGHKRSYFRSPWRVLDFLIAVFSVVAEAVQSSQYRALRALRAVRALRPLRLVSRFPQLQLVVDVSVPSASFESPRPRLFLLLLQALVAAVPRVFNVFVVLFLFVVIFGVVGVQSFGGVMSICTDPSVSNIRDCKGTFQLTGEECAFLPTDTLEAACKLNATGTSFPRLWTTFQNPDQSPESFDSIARSMLVVFELMTGGSWPVIMFSAVNGGDGTGNPRPYANPSAAIFFIISQVRFAGRHSASIVYRVNARVAAYS